MNVWVFARFVYGAVIGELPVFGDDVVVDGCSVHVCEVVYGIHS